MVISITLSGRPSSHVSVTRQPASVGSMRYAHLAKWRSPKTPSNANFSPGTHSMTSASVVHSNSPLRLCPVNIAPTSGPEKPSFQAQVWHSGDHSPMRVTSEMAFHTASGDASMSRDTSTCLIMAAERNRPSGSDAMSDLAR